MDKELVKLALGKLPLVQTGDFNSCDAAIYAILYGGQVPKPIVVRFAVNCATDSLQYEKEPKALQAAKACLELTERWLADPKAVSAEELRQAANKASSYANSAYYTAYSAYYAAKAAYYAAKAAYSAAHSAYSAYYAAKASPNPLAAIRRFLLNLIKLICQSNQLNTDFIDILYN